MTAPTTSTSTPPAGTYTSTVDSSGNPELVPSITGAQLTDAQGDAIAAWLKANNVQLNWTLLTAPWQAANPGGAPGFTTKADVLLATYAQALQGNKLDPGAANSGLDVQNPLTSIESFLSTLTNGNTWVRIAEFLVGGLMLGIAVSALVKNTTGASAGDAVSKAAKLSPVGRLANRSAPKQAPKQAPKAAPKPSAPLYEGRHDRYVGKRSVDNPTALDLSAPVL